MLRKVTDLPLLLTGKTVILGVGNRLRGDDGFGPALVERLSGKTGALLIDCASAPENYLGKITGHSPDVVIIADAADFGGEPGEIKIFGADNLQNVGLSTHNLSPKVFAEFLKKETGAEIYLLACQPKSLRFGEGLSNEVDCALERFLGGTGKCTNQAQ